MSLVWLVDATLASVGLAIAFAAVESSYGVLLALPLIVLLSVFSASGRCGSTTPSYRAALPIEEALAELQRNSGTQFHPRVVEAVVRVSLSG